MIFFYRVKTLDLKSVVLNDEVCTGCGKKGVMILHFKQRYLSAHMPVIPAGSYGEMACTQCSNVLYAKGFSSAVKVFYKQEKKTLKTPVRLWSGMFLLLILLFLIIGYPFYKAVSVNKQNILQQLLLTQLKPGDILRTLAIEEHVSASVPTFYKVSGILSDTVFLKRCNHNWPLADIKQWEKTVPGPDDFGDARLPFSLHAIMQRKELVSLKESNEKYINSSGSVLEIISGK